MPSSSPHLRPRDGGRQQTTSVELLFDLVYVFAVTQLSQLLIDRLTLAGAPTCTCRSSRASSWWRSATTC